MENTKTRREAAFLVIVVFMLGVLLGGVGNHLWGERVWGLQTVPHGRDQILSQLTSELQLSGDQVQQVTKIVDDTRAQMRALNAPLDSQKEEIRQQGRDRIRALLTPEQRAKFEEFTHRIDEQRKKDEGR
jgi:Spy/CpxP family protein refolding chaperone